MNRIERLKEELAFYQERRAFWCEKVTKQTAANRNYLASDDKHLANGSDSLQIDDCNRSDPYATKEAPATELHLYLYAKYRIEKIQKQLKRLNGATIPVVLGGEAIGSDKEKPWNYQVPKNEKATVVITLPSGTEAEIGGMLRVPPLNTNNKKL